MAQRGTNGRPVVLVLTLALVGALLVGLATAGLVERRKKAWLEGVFR